MSRRQARAAAPAARPAAERAASTILLLGTVAAGLLVDTGAESAFDAPKRFAAVLATLLAAALVAGFADLSDARRAWGEATLATKASIAAFGAGIVWIALSALLSPRQAASLATLRGTVVLALAAPLAAMLFDRSGMRRALVWFVALASVNSLLSLLQRAGGWKPFAIERISGRTEAIGLIGNEGVLALAAALGAIAAAALWLDSREGGRPVHVAAFVLNVAALAANVSLTPMLALGAGLAVFALFRLPRRRLAVGVGLLVVVAVAAFALLPQLRARAAEARRIAASGDWDALTSYRFGAWAAAGEMIAARPLTGFGPGTFASEFVTHRIDAEKRWGRRLVNPAFAGGSYEEAHSDYLQIAAESGLPAALLLLASFALAVLLLVRLARTPDHDARDEAQALLAIVAVVAVASLAWFPMQRPAMALLALMALGRSWSLSATTEEES
jgi:O-antigen ligase